jgi:hypothetical protein
VVGDRVVPLTKREWPVQATEPNGVAVGDHGQQGLDAQVEVAGGEIAGGVAAVAGGGGDAWVGDQDLGAGVAADGLGSGQAVAGELAGGRRDGVGGVVDLSADGTPSGVPGRGRAVAEVELHRPGAAAGAIDAAAHQVSARQARASVRRRRRPRGARR